MDHLSFRSCLDLNDLFRSMFPDSAVAQKFQLSKTKCAYLINFGLAVYYHKLLISEVKESPFFTLCFDESLNPVLQNCQMDCGVRYWDVKRGISKVRYLDSKFLNRPNSKNLFEKLLEVLSEPKISLETMIQLSMDGPYVNWEVLKFLMEKRAEMGYPDLLDIGSCGLHIIHGAFQTGMESQKEWCLKKILKAIFYLFHDSPARRDMYMKTTGSNVFALRFCATRWVESESVAERAIKIWPNMIQMIKEWEKQPKSSRPKNKSYETLVEFYQDKFVPCRLEYFRYLAKIMHDYLKIFQTDRPMVPFIADELEKQMRKITGIVLKRSVLSETPTPYTLIKLDLDSEKNLLPVDNINIGTGLKEMMKALSLKQEEKRKFLRECKLSAIALLKKMQERSPLKNSVCRNASSLSPNKMATEKDACVLKFNNLAESLSKAKLLLPDDADKAKAEYDQFINFDCKLNCSEFKKFDFEVDRVDEFLGKYLQNVEKYSSLYRIVMIICTMSHGQACIERGFSVNTEVLDPNMEELSLKSQRLVYDQILASEVKVHELKINKDLVKECKLAHRRYTEHLSARRDNKKAEENSLKRKSIDEEIVLVKRKKQEVEDTIRDLKKDADTLGYEAEKEENMTLLTKANAFRLAAKEKEETLKNLNIALLRMEKSKEDLK